jgi:hypothetical protein
MELDLWLRALALLPTQTQGPTSVISVPSRPLMQQ